MAETNRTPFDFAEGGSELVSGFNVEYRRGGFALIVLAEYARILFISILFCVISLIFYFKLTFLSFLFIWFCIRAPKLELPLSKLYNNSQNDEFNVLKYYLIVLS